MFTVRCASSRRSHTRTHREEANSEENEDLILKYMHSARFSTVNQLRERWSPGQEIDTNRGCCFVSTQLLGLKVCWPMLQSALEYPLWTSFSNISASVGPKIWSRFDHLDGTDLPAERLAQHRPILAPLAEQAESSCSTRLDTGVVVPVLSHPRRPPLVW